MGHKRLEAWAHPAILGLSAVALCACAAPSADDERDVGGLQPGDGAGAEGAAGATGGIVTGDAAGAGGEALGAAGSAPAVPSSPAGGSETAGAGGATAVVPPAGGTGAAPTVVDGRPVCAGFPVRADGLLVDFDTYDVVDGSWGDPAFGQLTGGTSPYSCADDGVSCPDTAVIARVRTGGGGLRIQATVPAQQYTGMVLWFGPCVDASAFAGIEFELGGELFGAVLSVKLQTHENYPIDLVNLKGGCEYTSEATKWSECVPPEYEIASTSSQPAPVRLSWADFANGLPNSAVAPDGLVGVELQFECPSEVDCAMDLRLGALRLTL